MTTAVDASPQDMLQILAPDGTVDASLDPGLSDELLLKCYRTMLQTRIMDERMLTLQRQGRIFFYLQSTGEEACGIGTVAALEDDDWVLPRYRQPGSFLFRGATPKEMVAQCFGNAWDTTKGRQMPVHYSFKKLNMVSISSPIGTQVIQATGVGMAMRRKGAKTCAITYIGDGGTSSNDFHSGMNFAAVDQAPVIFVCSNNGWAISCPTTKQTAAQTFVQKAQGYGMPGVRVDGNDLLAVYKATRDARDRAVAGGGPTFLELVTYRMGGHSSSDDPTRYVPAEVLERHAKLDPLERLRLYLTAKGLWDDAQEEAYRQEARDVVNQAIRDNERVAKPELESIFTDVYAALPATLQRDLEAEQDARGEGKFP